MSLRELVSRAKSKPTEPNATCRVPAGNVERSTSSGTTFTAGTSYLELRLAHMHLRDRREWWQQYLPLASILTEVQGPTGWPAVPTLVGSSQLVDQMQPGSGPVDIYNKRIAGPVPYVGDQVRIFASLYRTVDGDWAKRVLSILEIVAKQVDVTRLSSIVSVAPAVVDALEQLLGMEQVGIRLSMDRELVPGNDTDGENALVPGWIVLFGTADAPLPDDLRVHNDLLHVSTNGKVLRYTEADFLLLHLRALESRGDYETFDFHRQYWAAVDDRVWSGQVDAAKASWAAFVASLMQCVDLTRDQRRGLYGAYETTYQENLRLAATVAGGGARLDSTIQSRELTAHDLARAATSSAHSKRTDIEALLTAFAT
jgi:hypothetical protein